jgi:hypothetical protein
MKKLFAVIVSMLVMVVALTGCGSKEQGPSGTAAEIADKIFAEAEAEPFGPARGVESDDDMRFLLGSTEYPEFADFAGLTTWGFPNSSRTTCPRGFSSLPGCVYAR